MWGKCKILLFFFFFSLSAFSSNDEQLLSAYQLLDARGELYFLCTANSEQLLILSKILSIDKTEGHVVTANANRQEFEKFLSLNIPFTVIEPEIPQLKKRDILKKTDSSYTSFYYPSYPEYEQLMKNFAAKYPQICSLHEIGLTVKGRKLMYMKISDNVNQQEPEPRFLYSATIHGDETAGFILMLKLIDYLLSNYDIDHIIKKLVDEVEIWINPLANPDGLYYGGDTTVAFAIRRNANFVDLNRNFPDSEAGDHPDGASWQPETKAVMDFLTEHSFVLSANFHSGVEVVNYPWDYQRQRHVDDKFFRHIARRYVDTTHNHAPVGYMTYLDNGITNGYDWYQVYGGRQDYTTYFHRGKEMTIELSKTKLLNEDTLQAFWNYNYRSLINLIKESTYGIAGVVTDSATNDPLQAQIEVLTHDSAYSLTTTDALTGYYHRLIEPGTYDLLFTANGYKKQLLNGITVYEDTKTRINVKLSRNTAVLDMPFEIVITNPVHEQMNILIYGAAGLSAHIQIFDVNGKTMANISGLIAVSEQRWQINTVLWPPSVYFCRITIGHTVYERKVVKL